MSTIVGGMKHTLRSALALTLFTLVACKSKDQAAAAASGAALASGAVVSAGAASAGAGLAVLDGFEGEIGVSAKGKLAGKDSSGTPANLTLLVKDGKFRFELPEGLAGAQALGKAYVLVEPADKKLYAVMEDKKQAVLIDLDKLATQAKSFGGAAAQHRPSSGTPPQISKTGKTDTVAGYTCEIWHVVSEKSVGDLCVAEQGTSWFHIPLSGAPAEYAWASEITDGKHFPLRFVASENGVEQGRVEVTSIQKKALPAEQFQVPTGYAILNLEQMLGAMLGGMPGGMPGMPAGLPSGFVLPHGAFAGAHSAKLK
ncbi:MAG TPA: DUF4412 domain-containing protein [Polyangiaceae bacterium]